MFKPNFHSFDISSELLMDIVAQYLCETEQIEETDEGHIFVIPRPEGGVRVVVHEGMVH